jgi:cytochrome c553
MIVLLIALACRKPIPPAPPGPTDGPPDLTDEMEDHFYHALRLQLAVVGGDLAGAREAARTLRVEAAGAPRRGERPFLEATRSAAARAADANSIAEAADALGELSLACAGCHKARGEGPPHPVDARVPEDPMGRHLFGTYWLGYGLVAPDDRAWVAGAAALAVEAHRLPPGPPETLRKVHDLGLDALAARQPRKRAAIWAEMLTTCAACHATIPR